MSKEKHDNTLFYKAQDRWFETGCMKSWQTMFLEINGACLSRMKLLTQKCPGKHFDDLEERALETTIMIMDRIQRHYKEGRFHKIDNLSNYVFFPCYGVFFGKKQREIDNTESLDTLMEEQRRYETYE